MLKFIKANAVVITISVSFFVASFVVAAEQFELTDREIVIALIASAVCGATILVASMATAHVAPVLYPELDAAKRV